MRALGREDLPELRANPRFLIEELLERGVSVFVCDPERELFLLEHRGVKKWLLGIETEVLPWVSWELINDKALTKQFLESGGLSVPPGRRFAFRNIDVALLYAMQIGFPVVVKPFDGGRGQQVHLGLESIGAVEGAAEAICQRRADAYFLIEKQMPGEELRIFVTRSGRYAAVQRRPASVLGDGRTSVEELARRETERRMNPRVNCLGPIEIDEAAERWLRRQGMTRHTIVPEGIEVAVLGHVDASGAYAVDATERIHPSLAAICHRAIQQFPGVPYLGVDLVSTQPSAPQARDTYSILEVNNNAALGLHLAPAEGRGRAVTAAIADGIFPETETKNLELAPCLSL